MNFNQFEQMTILISGIAWTITYIALFYRGFKDKSYGMPFVALMLNFTWELTYSLIYPPHAYGLMTKIINSIWLICDIGILITFLLYGYKYFKEQYDLKKPVFYAMTFIGFTLCLMIMLVGGPFFADFSYFSNSYFESAKFIAFIQNAVMSVLFVSFFYSRKAQNHPIEGQSFTIALSKLIGTSLTVGISYTMAHPNNWYFIGIFVATAFIFDSWYAYLIYNELKRHHINPFTRL